MLSRRALNLKPSPTLSLVAKAKDLQAKGFDVISLTVGEPDWNTFEAPSKAGIEAIEKNITKYTPANGTIELRKRIAEKVKKEIGLDYTPNQVTVGSGAKFIIFAALQMICNPGDEVIIHSPYWVSYPTMVELADGVPHIVHCDEKEGFKLTPEKLEKAINSKTKAFLFCSPSNPTGLMYTTEELKAFAEVLRKFPQVVVISDDIYNSLVFDKAQRVNNVAPHLLHVAPDLKERVILINGGSKAFSMTGWRIGWALGPQKIITAMADYQSQSTGSASSISQHAVLSALNECDTDIEKVNEKLSHRKQLALSEFKRIPLFKISEPQGAFYLWVNVKELFGKKFQDLVIENDKMVGDILLEKFYVATVPGIECGNQGYLRLSFATTEEKMKKAIDRMVEFISQLK
ncbi:MAG: pyridoxal phosphate-dependent aminotransferase [Bdellovibrionaceae bacterium]|nr:pyridoxal phosphate-dependent aminotransferase [Pseudobdellovibrionaceae bacterium]NUM59422.1 pyridoxal phosphate-dependent aminotransferase [Pseudobdellovibrionaceae bacterium]